MMIPEQPHYKFYRAKEICAILGVTRTTLMRWRRFGDFPNPIKIGPKTSVWPADEIRDWINRHIDHRDRS